MGLDGKIVEGKITEWVFLDGNNIKVGLKEWQQKPWFYKIEINQINDFQLNLFQ